MLLDVKMDVKLKRKVNKEGVIAYISTKDTNTFHINKGHTTKHFSYQQKTHTQTLFISEKVSHLKKLKTLLQLSILL